MSSIFPLRETVSLDKREPRLIELDEETADEVFEALSSETTRKMFLELYESPQTTSDLAEATDTSVQNAQYHLEKLRDANLIEVVDTWYSERGSEMKVFAPKDESLVLFAGGNKRHSLRQLLDRIVGILGVLIPSSALVGLAATWRDTTGGSVDGPTPNDSGGDADGSPETDAAGANDTDGETETTRTETEDAPDGDGDGSQEEDYDYGTDAEENDTLEPDGGDAAAPEDVDADIVNETLDGSTEAADAAAGIDPLFAAALFFLGGLFVFTAVMMWYGPGLRGFFEQW